MTSNLDSRKMVQYSTWMCLEMASNEDDEVVLQNTFYLYEGPRCHVILDRNGLVYRKLNCTKNESERVCLRDIVGCECMRDRPKRESWSRAKNNTHAAPCERVESDGAKTTSRDVDQTLDINIVYICFYCYPLKRKRMGKKMVRTRITLVFIVDYHAKMKENLDLAERWKNATFALIRRDSMHSSTLNLSPRKLLIFVNPRSGPGKALQIFQQRVIPILAEAHVEYSLVVTDKSNHARQFVATCTDLNYWDGIVIVSGDGLLFEVFNGLMERTDWRSAIKTPVGVVPGGSGNGLARAIGHALDEEPYLQHAVLSSSLNLVSGRTKLMDLIRVEMQSETCYSFLSIGWGLLADIDIESEKMRSIGELRFALWSLAKIIGLRSYSGRVSYVPVNAEADLPPSLLSRSATFPESSVDAAERDSRYSVNGDEEKEEEEKGEGEGEGDCASLLPPLSEPIPRTWMSFEDSFLLVYVVYQTHIGSEVFFAPSARLDDGIMWLLTVRKGASRKQLLSFMLSLESGGHTRCPFVAMIPVRAVRIEPFTDGGHMTVDGENVECGPMQAEVLPSLARIMVR